MIVCPEDMVVDNDPGECTAVVYYTPSGSDNCVRPVTASGPPPTAICPSIISTAAFTLWSQPPLFSWVEFNLYHKGGNKKRLRDVVPVLERYFNWLETRFKKENGFLIQAFSFVRLLLISDKCCFDSWSSLIPRSFN